MCVPFVKQAPMNLLQEWFFVPICPLPPRLDRRRKAEEEEMQEEVEGQVAVAASSVARRLAVLSEQTILSSMDLDRWI